MRNFGLSLGNKTKKIPIEQDRKVHIELSFCSDSTWTVASEHLKILELLFILSFSLYFRAQSSLRWWKTGWATWWRRMRRMSRPKHKSGPETTGIAGRTVTTDLIYLIVPEKCFNHSPELIQNLCTGSSIGVKRWGAAVMSQKLRNFKRSIFFPFFFLAFLRITCLCFDLNRKI